MATLFLNFVKIKVESNIHTAHFKKERFALNFLTPQNASKFAIHSVSSISIVVIGQLVGENSP